MPEITKCPLCKNKPFVRQVVTRTETHDNVSCCGMEAASIIFWNRYAEAMELAMLRAEYERECDTMGDEEQKELWDAITDANKRVLEVFK